jgi:amino acid adenylation domain-containing protein
LYRYTGQEEIVVGTPIANRNRTEIEGLIGFFVNTLVIKTHVDGCSRLKNLIGLVRETALGAYAHQDLPFEKLVDELRPERGRGRTPLFQTVFGLQNVAREPLNLSALEATPVMINVGSSKFDLALLMGESPEGIRGGVEYNIDLFDRTTIERIIRHFKRICESMADDVDKEVNAIKLLSDEEEQQITKAWRGGRTAYPRKSIAAVFEEEAIRRGDAIAVEYESSAISYEELNRRGNQMARYLRRKGVGPEVTVGVCVERSIETVTTLLGILKAGGAYVPMDESYPRERLAYMVEEAGVELIVKAGDSEKVKGLAASEVRLGEESNRIANEGVDEIESGAGPDNLAYIMYTSGSTGKPKGVEITHRGVVRLVKEIEYLDLSENEVILHSAPITFDASTFEIWGSLLNGGKLVVMRRGRYTAKEMGEEIERKRTTTVWIPAALFQEMVGQEMDKLRGVERVISGGEVLSVTSVERLLEGVEGIEVVNAYGPTENTAFTTCHVMKSARKETGSVPIGKTIENTDVYVLGRNMEVVPIEVIGEMYVGGDGIARGYRMRKEDTGEKFTPNPYAKEGGERLYRTGDYVKHRSNGVLEFIGRVDHQVKIRGYRIETGEIEEMLGEHPAVKETVVVVREGTAGDKRLAAYVSGRTEGALTAAEMRKYARERLPEYMMPGTFIVMDKLPRAQSGKIDRRALPEVGEMTRGGEESFLGARTPIEEVLIGIWSELLELRQIDIHDDFFELGGHSLLATRVNSSIRKALNVDLPIAAIFEFQTIEKLSAAIDRAMREDRGVAAPAIKRLETGNRAPLSFAQQRLWFLWEMAPESPAYNIPLAVRLIGHLQVSALCRAFDEVLRRHEALRTRFDVVDAEPVGIVAQNASLRLPVVDLTELSARDRKSEAGRITEQQAVLPFDLKSELLLRSLLLHLDRDEHLLLITMHHIASDGWSLGVLTREMGLLYGSFSAGGTSPLEGLPIQYSDYTRWQKERLRGELLDQLLAYWRRQLAGLPFFEITPDRPRPPVMTYTGAHHQWRLSTDASRKLKVLSRRQGATLFMTLLAAFDVLLHYCTGERDIVVGTDIANRGRHETEHLIGFFVNQLVLRTVVAGDPTFIELLDQVREVALEAYAHQDLPFDSLVDALNPKREPGLSPLFQIKLVVQNAPVSDLDVQGLKIAPVVVESGTAKLNMTFNLADSPDGVTGSLEYNTDLYEPSTITRLLDQFGAIVAAVVEKPDMRVSELCGLLDEAARERQSVRAEEYKTAVTRSLGHLRRRIAERSIVSD